MSRDVEDVEGPAARVQELLPIGRPGLIRDAALLVTGDKPADGSRFRVDRDEVRVRVLPPEEPPHHHDLPVRNGREGRRLVRRHGSGPELGHRSEEACSGDHRHEHEHPDPLVPPLAVAAADEAIEGSFGGAEQIRGPLDARLIDHDRSSILARAPARAREAYARTVAGFMPSIRPASSEE